jgi:PAS domain S-box-containing protein
VLLSVHSSSGHAAIRHTGASVGLLAYLFTCALIIAAGEAARRARARASDQRKLLRVTLGSIGDAVITTDTKGLITYLNTVAEQLTGWSQEALGQPLERVFKIVNEDTRAPVDNPAVKALRDGTVVGLANHTLLIRKDGPSWPSMTAPRRLRTTAAWCPDAS